MKSCLISFSSKDYNKKLLHLLDSAIEHWKGDYLIYSPDHELSEYKGIPIYKGYPQPQDMPSFTHDEMPYQFKIALIQQAAEMGYERIVWLDTSMQLAKDITPLFGEMGIGVFHNLGHDLYKYISDDAQISLGISDDFLMKVTYIWGGALFFDFSKKNAIDVFERIKKYSLNGSFKDGTSQRPGFIAHRHDQSVLSVLVYGHSDVYNYGMIASKEHARTKEYGNNYFIIYG